MIETRPIGFLLDSRFCLNTISGVSTTARCLLIVALLAGCNDQPLDVVEEPEPIDLSGVWDFTEVIFRSTQPVVCRDTGSYWLSSSRNTFAGAGEKVGTCRGLVASFADARTFNVTGSVLRDSLVEFVISGGCGDWDGEPIDARYRGTVSRGPPLRMSGNSACSVNFNGTWAAIPATPTTSIRLEPDTASMVLHETIFLKPIMRSSSGARVFERDLEWRSEDTAIVVAGEDGSLFAAGVGTTTIEVKTIGLAAGAAIRARSINLMSVHAGAYHSCGLSDEGDALCWGANDMGQSGPSPSLAPCPGVLCRRAPGAVPGPAPFDILTIGTSSSCGIGLDGIAYCWGGNGAGQLGIGEASMGTRTPTAVSGGHAFQTVSVGNAHACGVTTDGLAYCWGSNNRGQIGPVASAIVSVPQLVSSELSFSSVHAGGLHTCGLATEGTAYCWGWNWDSQLGNDTVIASSEPLSVSGGFVFSSIAVGAAHNCGLTPDGKAFCWGDGEWGQLGIDSIDFTGTPAAVTGDLTFVRVITKLHRSARATLV